MSTQSRDHTQPKLITTIEVSRYTATAAVVFPFPDVYFYSRAGNTGMAVLIPGIPGRPGMTNIMRD